MIAGRLPLRPAGTRTRAWNYCNEHASLVGPGGICPGPAFDLGLAQRSVTLRAAYAFGDWPPGAGEWAALAAADPLYLDDDR